MKTSRNLEKFLMKSGKIKHIYTYVNVLIEALRGEVAQRNRFAVTLKSPYINSTITANNQ